jgi:hypothetical protein
MGARGRKDHSQAVLAADGRGPSGEGTLAISAFTELGEGA